MEEEVDYVGVRVLAFKLRLGFGLYITHSDNEMIGITEEGNLAFFEGLKVFLPFVEFIAGTVWTESTE